MVALLTSLALEVKIFALNVPRPLFPMPTSAHPTGQVTAVHPFIDVLKSFAFRMSTVAHPIFIKAVH